jgi:DNA-binding winged helix-turn-helix (wHTH) protein
MSEPTCHRQSFRLGPWSIAPEDSGIRGQGHFKKIDYKAMHVLCFLADQAEKTVYREAIFDHVWPGTAVTDDVLTVAISALRRALEDDARNPAFIRTFPKRGYRLLLAPSGMEEQAGQAMALPWRRRVLYAFLVFGAAWITVLTIPTRFPKTEGAINQQPAQLEQPATPAYDLYLKARYLLYQESPTSLAEALEAIEESIALSSQFAAAHAFRAEVLFLQVERGLLAPEDGFARGREAGQRALDLDPDLADAHAAKAIAAFGLDWDFEEAARSFDRALKYDTENLVTLKWYTRYLVVTGRAPEAVEVARRIHRIDPDSYVNLQHVHALSYSGRHDAALRRLQEIHSLMPSRPGIHAAYAQVYLQSGQHDAAVRSFLQFADAAGWPMTEQQRLRDAFASGGAQAVYRHLAGEESPLPSTAIRAKLHAVLGQDEEALELLEASLEARDMNILWIQADSSFDHLRSSARFRDIVRKIGLSVASVG